MSADLEDVEVKAVLFDVYRTLIDIWTDEHRPELWTRMAWTLRYHGIACESERLRHDFFDRSHLSQQESMENHPEVDVMDIFRGMLNDLGSTEGEPLVESVTRQFRILSLQHLDLFPDTLPTLKALRAAGIKIGLVSDAQRVFLDHELALLHLPQWVDTVVISSEEGFQKPDDRLFRKALDDLRVRADQAVFVGDTVSRDICGAKRAKLRAFLINRDGRAERQESDCKPDDVFHSLHEFRASVFPHLEAAGG